MTMNLSVAYTNSGSITCNMAMLDLKPLCTNLFQTVFCIHFIWTITAIS
jgi:hypothetical protein